MQAFRDAVEARDTARIADLLADDVVFVSPVAFKPYPGKPLTAAILRAAMRVFADFRYVRQIEGTHAEGGADSALVFEATVNGKALTGCDFIRVGADGLITELMVMVRPLSGASALAEAMGAQFDQITREAAAASGADVAGQTPA